MEFYAHRFLERKLLLYHCRGIDQAHVRNAIGRQYNGAGGTVSFCAEKSIEVEAWQAACCRGTWFGCSGRRHTRFNDRGRSERPVLDRSIGTDQVSHLNVGEGDGVAALAEGGKLSSATKAWGGVVNGAHEGDSDAINGGHLAHDPGLAVVGLHLVASALRARGQAA